MKMLAIALLVAISYAQTDVKHSSRRFLQAKEVNYWSINNEGVDPTGFYNCDTVDADHDCLANGLCVEEPNCPSRDGQAVNCDNASTYDDDDGVSRTCPTDCVARANAGECGLNPNMMRECCKSQCRVECDADLCTCSGLAPGLYTSPEYGSTCDVWDIKDISPFYDTCTATSAEQCGRENWCIATWCYVLNGQCEGAAESSRFPGYFFSYPKCDTPDCYTCTLDGEDACPDDCPYVPEGVELDCDCPVFCTDEWKGDGQCDRRDNGYDCRNCLSFYTNSDGSAASEQPADVDDPPLGTFDCDVSDPSNIVCDCDPVESTTADPHYIPHNMMVIDGEMYCRDMIGVCSSVSFQANIAERDWASDPNNYGDLASRGVGRQGWFALQMVNTGDFHADLLSTRIDGDSEVDHPIEYVIYGPFDDYRGARNACPAIGATTGGNLGGPTDFSTEALARHRIELDDAVAGKFYVFMVSDRNPTQGTITLNAHGDNEDDDTLVCNVQVQDDFGCAQNDLVKLNFTTGTSIIRHNLGGYWAENHAEHGQLNSVPLGIYYADVGTYTLAENHPTNANEEKSLGLRVTAKNAGAYRCAYYGNTNACANVMTGLDLDDGNNDGTMPMYPVDDDGPVERFGQISMQVGAVELEFEVVFDNPGSNEQYRNGQTLQEFEGDADATWDRIKLSIFDIDSKVPDGEKVQIVNAQKICPGGVVVTGVNSFPYYLTDLNYLYLDFSDNDFQSASGYRWDVFSGCWVRRSTDSGDSVFTVGNLPNCVQPPGTSGDMTDTDKCKHNNPYTPQTLDTMQKLMSVEAEFTDVGSEGMQVNFIVSRDHSQSRNLWFGGESVSIGRKCCKDVVDCPNGYKNADLECTDVTGNDDQCTTDNCCDTGGSSHGDPIIHTFHHDCYDLHKDGNYLATAHPDFDHKVYVAVYNDYIRQVSVTGSNDEILLSVNNFGEVLNNGWVAFLKVQTLQCPEDYKKDDCVGEYINVSFDAQDLFYDVRIGMRHTYKDPALKRGEAGFHMDIVPQPYFKQFKPRKKDYTGLYFYNPLPEELPQCSY